MLPLVLGIFSTSISGGQIMSRTGRYKWMPITGAVVVGAAFVGLSRIAVDTYVRLRRGAHVRLRRRARPDMQVVVTAVQNSVDRRHMGVATASVTFFRSMGGAVGTALFGAILNLRLAHHLAAVIPAGAGAQAGAATGSVSDVSAIRALPEPVRTWVLTAFTQAMDDLFLVAVPFLVVGLVIALLMREKPLGGRETAAPPRRRPTTSSSAPAADPPTGPAGPAPRSAGPLAETRPSLFVTGSVRVAQRSVSGTRD